jgi:hypothetical protein
LCKLEQFKELCYFDKHEKSILSDSNFVLENLNVELAKLINEIEKLFLYIIMQDNLGDYDSNSLWI